MAETETAARVLVVDDNEAGRYATARVLRAAGFEVLEAATGAGGLALAGRADAIVLDVRLPDADGRDVCRDLRARAGTARVPIVHLSAVFVGDEDRVRGLEGGADAYLTRPVSGSVLAATVRALLRARRAEERATRARDEFLAAASHELRTPLSMILLWAKMLEAGRVPEEGRAEAVRTIVHCAEVQQRVVEDLLDASALAGGRVRLDLRAVDLGRVVRGAVEALRPAAAANGVALAVAGGFGARPVRCDAGRVEQVVTNLVANALKFTPAGGRVCVRMSRPRGAARVTVTDTGEGIDAEFLPHVFERFRQADGSVTRRAGGLGLGLTISRELVELHGGRIRAASGGPGRGATFTVDLPCG